MAYTWPNKSVGNTTKSILLRVVHKTININNLTSKLWNQFWHMLFHKAINTNNLPSNICCRISRRILKTCQQVSDDLSRTTKWGSPGDAVSAIDDFLGWGKDVAKMTVIIKGSSITSAPPVPPEPGTVPFVEDNVSTTLQAPAWLPARRRSFEALLGRLSCKFLFLCNLDRVWIISLSCVNWASIWWKKLSLPES